MKTTSVMSFSIPLAVIAKLQVLADRLHADGKIKKNSLSVATSYVLEQALAEIERPAGNLANEDTRNRDETDSWARIKHRIEEGRCIGCGEGSDLKLYISFCSDCLAAAGVKVEFVHNPEGDSSVSDKDQRWLRFMGNLFRPDEPEDERGQ
jgi:hypothetical protein